MKIKATAVQHRVVLGGDFIDGRYEIQWHDGGPWLSMGGIMQYDRADWYVKAAIMAMGAQYAIDVKFIYEDLQP